MRLEVFSQEKAQLWDELVDSSIGGTLYHTWDWLKIVEKHSGYKLYPLVFYDKDDDKPFGLFPLFHKKMFGVSMVFSPPPGTAITLGPVLIDKGYRQHRFELANLAFQKNIDEFINNLKADYIFISTSPGLSDMRSFQWAGYEVTPVYTYKIVLTQPTEEIRANFSQTLRNSINRRVKSGLIYEERNDSDSIKFIYDKTFERYSEQGLSFPVSRDYIIDLFTSYRFKGIKSYVIIENGDIVGGGIYILYKGVFSEWFGAFRSTCGEANELLRWSCICRAKQENYQWFELIGANTPNLCSSKAKFNPDLVCLFQIKKSNIKGKLAERAYMFIRKYNFKIFEL
jgi:hypothetical protein